MVRLWVSLDAVVTSTTLKIRQHFLTQWPPDSLTMKYMIINGENNAKILKVMAISQKQTVHQSFFAYFPTFGDVHT